MSALASTLAGLAVFAFAARPSGGQLIQRLSAYLAPGSGDADSTDTRPLRLAMAGLDWQRDDARARFALAGLVGGGVGWLFSQPDVILAGRRSAIGLTIVGATTAALSLRMWITRRLDDRRERLEQELPTAADSLAMSIVAGRSVLTAIEDYATRSDGVAAQEMRRMLAAHDRGEALVVSLTAAGRRSAAPGAARLYRLLANAHRTGGQLADALTELAKDYRAALARKVTAEGGRRAIATYGPILALMVPVTVVFLMYPTLVGLADLSVTP